MSIARDVRNYLKNKPYILEALEKDIVNLSKLARQIQLEFKIKNFSAIKAALRRFSEENKKCKHRREEKVLRLLKKSNVTVYDGNSIIITDEPTNIKEKVKLTLEDSVVYLIDKAELPKISKNILKKNENCSTFVIKSPEEIETTPGVVAFLTSLLSEQNVNVIEFISCWIETIIVVDRKDSLRAYEILMSVIG
jgi:polynucleotide 5'-kinase involved in rRNA processing